MSCDLSGCQDLNSFKHCDLFVNSPIFRLEASQVIPSLDVVARTDRHIVAIQVAVAPKHDAKPAGLLDELEEFIPTKFKKGRTWYHGFVTDDIDGANAKQSSELKDQVSHFERDLHLLCGPLTFLTLG